MMCDGMFDGLSDAAGLSESWELGKGVASVGRLREISGDTIPCTTRLVVVSASRLCFRICS